MSAVLKVAVEVSIRRKERLKGSSLGLGMVKVLLLNLGAIWLGMFIL